MHHICGVCAHLACTFWMRPVLLYTDRLCRLRCSMAATAEMISPQRVSRLNRALYHRQSKQKLFTQQSRSAKIARGRDCSQLIREGICSQTRFRRVLVNDLQVGRTQDLDSGARGQVSPETFASKLALGTTPDNPHPRKHRALTQNHRYEP